MGKVAGKVSFKAKMFSRFPCLVRREDDVLVGPYKSVPLSASVTRKRRSLARAPLLPLLRSIGHFQSAEQMFNRLSERRRCSLACIAIYRVAVGFTSRRISKGPRSAFHSFQALLLYSAAVTARNGRASILEASFSIKERSNDRYLDGRSATVF